MHNAATWLELAANARSHADGMTDPGERQSVLAQVADYERQARETASEAVPDQRFGISPCPIW